MSPHRSTQLLDVGVLEIFTSTWFNAYDDITWFFLRDAAYVIPFFSSFTSFLHDFSTFVSNCQSDAHPHVAENFLSILERLKRFPSVRSDINQWWIPQLGKKPPPFKSSKASVADEVEEDEPENPEGDEDDWRKFFEEPVSNDKNKKTGPSPRLHKMTVHQSLHSLQSHKAVFSRAWMALLPRLSRTGDVETTKALATRVLNIMHGGVMPRLTRPVLTMDWIGSCVDYGYSFFFFRSHNHATLTAFDPRRNYRLVGLERFVYPNPGLQPVSAPPFCRALKLIPALVIIHPSTYDYTPFWTAVCCITNIGHAFSD